MDINLHSIQDDFNLTANGDTARGDAVTFVTDPYYLTDPQGNKLTDPQGNYLVGRHGTMVHPQMLHAIPDDFNLTAE